MQRLTPELTCMSGFLSAAPGQETRELDFNLARRSGVLINHIIGLANVIPLAVTGDGQITQELDLAPDNVTIWEQLPGPDAVDYDSSRIFRQTAFSYVNIAVATQGLSVSNNQVLKRDWSHLPMNERPISMTSMRHNVQTTGIGAGAFETLMIISYVIVEMNLTEIGVLNASRR